MQIEKIQFGTAEISFDLVFKQRKSLGITVTPDRNVLVKAPVDASLDKIKEKVKKRAPWILKQQSYFLSFHPLTPPRKYISGETHLYLGRQYRLKIFEAEENEVKLKEGFLQVYTNRKDDTRAIKKHVSGWYEQHARGKFEQYAEPWIEKFSKYKVVPHTIEIRNMPKRWGSCTPKGKVILNTELIKAPKGCIEYVIVHELCHLVHHNHSKAFFELQTKEMPNWERWKDRLERILA
ncbi:MAG: M48 family metallopeptidase [bacterium]